MSVFRTFAVAFVPIAVACSLPGCAHSRDGGSEWGLGDASDTVTDTSADTTDTRDGGELSESLRACCERHNVPAETCRERKRSSSAGPLGRCAGNSGCTDLSEGSGCGCRCTLCHDETCLRVLCVDRPGCGGRDGGT